MKTASYTDLRKNLKTYIDSVIDDSETVIINRSGGTGVVIISLEEYNSIKETEYIMSSPAWVARIKEAEREIREGKYDVINVADLWK
jgi:antitoxin YefM